MFREAYLEGSDASLPLSRKIKSPEKGGCYIGNETRPGITREQALEMIPDMIIGEGEAIDDEGWYKHKEIESTDQCLARIKDLLKDFKDFYRANKEQVHGKTFVSITHGSFLNTLGCMFTNNLGNAQADFFIPENNSVSILDFSEVKEGQKEYVDCRLTAFNLKIKSPKQQ